MEKKKPAHHESVAYRMIGKKAIKRAPGGTRMVEYSGRRKINSSGHNYIESASPPIVEPSLDSSGATLLEPDRRENLLEVLGSLQDTQSGNIAEAQGDSAQIIPPTQREQSPADITISGNSSEEVLFFHRDDIIGANDQGPIQVTLPFNSSFSANPEIMLAEAADAVKLLGEIQSRGNFHDNDFVKTGYTFEELQRTGENIGEIHTALIMRDNLSLIGFNTLLTRAGAVKTLIGRSLDELRRAYSPADRAHVNMIIVHASSLSDQLQYIREEVREINDLFNFTPIVVVDDKPKDAIPDEKVPRNTPAPEAHERLIDYLKAGINNIIPFDISPEELRVALSRIANSDKTDGMLATGIQVASMVGKLREKSSSLDLSGLTGQEQVVVGLIGRGFSNAAIAKQLNVKESTVKTHVSRILKETGARNRFELMLNLPTERERQDDTTISLDLSAGGIEEAHDTDEGQTERLSPMEKIVRDLLRSGLNQLQVARQLKKHRSTIRSYIKKIDKKEKEAGKAFPGDTKELTLDGNAQGSEEVQQYTFDTLNDREREVLSEILARKSNREIADKLNISLAMVKKHVLQVFTKTGATSRLALQGIKTEKSGTFDYLTRREREVLAGIAAGQSNDEIATDFGMSKRTVRAYVSSIFTKTGATSRLAFHGVKIIEPESSPVDSGFVQDLVAAGD